MREMWGNGSEEWRSDAHLIVWEFGDKLGWRKKKLGLKFIKVFSENMFNWFEILIMLVYIVALIFFSVHVNAELMVIED